MKIGELLKGKKVEYITDAEVTVVLEIKHAELKNHSIDLEPATPQNDWWPPSRDWTTIEVEFTNGFKKSYNSLSEIKEVKEEK